MHAISTRRPVEKNSRGKLPYFLGLWLHLHLSGISLYLFSSSILLPNCVRRLAFLRNFGRSPSRTSLLAWYLTLVDYRLLQFHTAIPTASVLHVIFFPLIDTGNETGSPSDVLDDSLDLCGTIISSLN